ncbi:hypothetical protein [Methylobacterium nigriterrae]|uniref:hypothetical protein n=1 Tax=Methylobacterium nigriterrae TaxID=3127512 RepID=UPI003013A2FA
MSPANKAPAAGTTSNPEECVSGRCDPFRAAEAAPGPYVPGENLEKRQDQLLDEAVEETFPASDPIAPKRITK